MDPDRAPRPSDAWRPPGQRAPHVPTRPDPSDLAWGSAAHWTALVAAWVALAFLGPLLVLLVRGDASPWVRRQAVDSLNFQLSALIYGVVGSVLGFVVAFVTFGFGLLAVVPIALALVLAWFVLTVFGAVSASRGGDFRYPLTLPLVR